MSSVKSRNTLQDTVNTAVKNFCQDMTFIIDVVYGKNKKDNLLIDVRDKFVVIRKENPNGIVEVAGPYIWKYREQIKNKDANFFLHNTFENDIINSQGGVAEITPIDDITVILNKCKLTWHTFQKIEQDTIMKHVQNLLRSYATYVSATKEIAKIDNKE